MDRLLADLWKRRKVRGLDPDPYDDRLRYTRELIATGTDNMERLEQALSRGATDATSLHLIPLS